MASQSLRDALLSWRSLLPRSAHGRFAAEFLRAGLPLLALRTNQIPGADVRLEPVAPTALFGTLPGASVIIGRLGDGLFPLWNPAGQIAAMGIALAYGGVALVVGRRSGLLRHQERWSAPRRLLPNAGLWLLPALGEELLFRGLLLPSALDGVAPLALLPWMALSVGLFVAWRGVRGQLLSSSQRGSGLQDPRVLVQTALLGLACSLIYSASGSLWWAVLLHWLAVVAWRHGLGGSRQVEGSGNRRVVALPRLRRVQFQQDRSASGDGGAA